MIRRLLVAPYPNDPGSPALQWAAALADHHDSEVTTLDLCWPQPEQTVISGDGAWPTGSAQTDAHRLRPTASAGSPGVSGRSLSDLRRFYDLLMVDGEALVHDAVHDAVHAPWALLDSVVPLLIVQRAPPPLASPTVARPLRVMTLIDGQAASMGTLHRYLQMRPFGVQEMMDVVHVQSGASHQDQLSAELLVRRTGDFIRAHGCTHVTETRLTTAQPAEAVADHVNRLQADLVLMSAGSRSNRTEQLLGLLAHHLLGHTSASLFLGGS
ncbi:MAG: hypothetical protein AAF970_07685 [Bacteroidota bacterium]